MPRITVEELVEKQISELKEKESEKKSELPEIQAELKTRQKVLEVLGGNSAGRGKTKSKVE